MREISNWQNYSDLQTEPPEFGAKRKCEVACAEKPAVARREREMKGEKTSLLSAILPTKGSKLKSVLGSIKECALLVNVKSSL